MTRRRARLVTLLGVLVALAGLAGFWLTADVERSDLTADQRERLGIGKDEFHVSFLLAGRDVDYIVNHTEPVYSQSGAIIDWQWDGYSTMGIRTDTILYVSVRGSDISLIAIPRDLFLEDGYRKINAVWQKDGPEGLMREVSAVLDVPIDYYAIIKLDIFENLVDALGGVTIDVPYRMLYHDNAGGLHIDFQPGPQEMSGADAAKFVRYRNLLRGDIDRIDNIKRLAYAMLERVKELNVRAVTVLPGVIDTFFSDVETNATLSVIRDLTARLPNLAITTTATLPIASEESRPGLGSIVTYDPVEVNRFMAATFGGRARDFAEAPDVTLLVTDRSGVPGVADWYVERLVKYGVPEAAILVREGAEPDPTPTRLLSTLESWGEADFFAELLNVGKQQVDRFDTYQRQRYQVELVLGADAETRTARIPPVLASQDEPLATAPTLEETFDR